MLCHIHNIRILKGNGAIMVLCIGTSALISCCTQYRMQTLTCKSSQGPVLQSLLSRERATGAVPELTAAFMVFPVNYYYFTFTSISQAIFILKIWGKIHIQLLYIYFICYWTRLKFFGFCNRIKALKKISINKVGLEGRNSLHKHKYIKIGYLLDAELIKMQSKTHKKPPKTEKARESCSRVVHEHVPHRLLVLALTLPFFFSRQKRKWIHWESFPVRVSLTW